MATLKKELKAILDKYEIAYNDKDKVWDCHGTLVLYHKAYEIIAVQENIVFAEPVVIEASSKDKTAVILVVGKMGEREEWSFGEACPSNSKNSYPFAMAEKRAKDRVVAKLVGLAQYVYSEDEADDFKTAKPFVTKETIKEVKPVEKDIPLVKDFTQEELETLINGIENCNADEFKTWVDRAFAAKPRIKSEIQRVSIKNAMDTRQAYFKSLKEVQDVSQ